MTEGLRWSHVRLVAAYWMRFSLRTGGGLMALFFVLTVGLGVAAAFVSPLEAMMKEGEGVGHTGAETAAWVDKVAGSEQVVDVVDVLLGDRDQTTYLLRERPALLSVMFLVLLIAFPFTVCLAGFNQTAGEIGSGGLRYLLLRTERPNVFLGRFLGAAAFTAGALALTFLVIFAYVALKFPIYGTSTLAAWSLQGYGACLFVALPYLALCAWISGMLDGAFGALALCELAVGFPVLLLHLASSSLPGEQGWLLRLLPWGWKYDLLHGDLATRLLARGAMVLFTAVFLVAGLRAFARRDL
jgi:ABC-type transport system involved in multi-copper enzyme maturation permease subunit